VSVGGYMRPYTGGCREEDLEELRLGFKHADYLLDCGDVIVVVEETSRPELKDVEKVENTINWLYSERGASSNRRVLGVVHHTGGASAMLVKYLLSKTRGRVVYRAANCRTALEGILRELGLGVQNA
jgi:hypothetical protein